MVKNTIQHDDNQFDIRPAELPESVQPIEAILSNINIATQEQNSSPSTSDSHINGIVIGKIVRINKKKIPLVDFEYNTSDKPVAALSTVPVVSNDKGREAALGFVSGNPRVPIILGFMHQPESTPDDSDDSVVEENNISSAVTVEKDDETVIISAEKQIVLKCGESSITLTRAGKVLLNGKYVSSRSKGVNRVCGGSVLIN